MNLRLILFVSISIYLVGCNSYTEPKNVNQLMKRAVSVYNQKISKNPYVARAAYKEQAKCSGVYCMYTTGYGYLYSAGYESLIPRDNFKLLLKNVKKTDRGQSWLETIENTYATTRHKKQTGLPPGYGSAFTAFRRFEMKGFLTEDNMRNYSFTIVDTLDNIENESSAIVIQFKSQKNPAEYRGSILLDSETFSIRNITLEKCHFYSENFRKWISVNGVINYDLKGKQSFISTLKFHFNKNNIEYWIEIKSESPLRQLEVDKRAYNAFSRDYNPYVYYNAEKWSNTEWANILQFSIKTDFEKLQNDLGSGKELQKQYTANSSKPFYTGVFDDGKELSFGFEGKYQIIKQKIDEFDKIVHQD